MNINESSAAQIMVPGSFNIIHDFCQDSGSIFLSSLRYIPGEGIRLNESSLRGIVYSRRNRMPLSFNNVILSWNLDLPEGTGACIEVRALNDEGEYTPWYEMARPSNMPLDKRRIKNGKNGRIDADTFVLNSLWTILEYRVFLYTQEFGRTPTLRLMSICFADTDNRVPVPSQSELKDAISLPIPWRSQYWEDPSIKGRICGPTSLSMALEYFGFKMPTAVVAEQAYDTENGIYGNWPFLAQTAAKQGLKSYVTRYKNFESLRKDLADGHPVILSVGWKEGELRNAPIPSTPGHLILCVGMTAEGHLLCNDPAGSSDDWNHAVYHRDDMSVIWLRNGGVGIPIGPNK